MHARVDPEGKTTVILAEVTYTVASLVATAFLPPPRPGMLLYHRDFDGTNNRVTNLAYATRGDITLAAYTHHGLQGERNPHARLSDTDVARIRALHGERSAREIAAEYEIARGTVYQIQSGRSRAAAGLHAGTAVALGARIKAIRMQRKLSVAAMASALEITVSAMKAWERGDKQPRYPKKIMRLLAQIESGRMQPDGDGGICNDISTITPSARETPARPRLRETPPVVGVWHVSTE